MPLGALLKRRLTVLKKWYEALGRAANNPVSSTNILESARRAHVSRAEAADIERIARRVQDPIKRARIALEAVRERSQSVQAYEVAVKDPELLADVSRIVRAALGILPKTLAEECQTRVELGVHMHLAKKCGRMNDWRREAEQVAKRKTQTIRQNAAEFDAFIKEHPEKLAEWEKIARWHVPRNRRDDWDDEILNEILDTFRLSWPEVKNPDLLARRIAKRKACKLRNAANRNRNALAQKYWETPLTDSGPHPADVLAEPEEKEEFQRAIEGLPEKDRQILDAYLEKGSMRRAAASLGMPLTNYRRQFRRILRDLP